MENLNPGNVFFVEQQRGPIETEFTSRVSDFFEASGKEVAAYLCRVCYGDFGQVSVALCIASLAGEQRDIVDGICKIFKEMFGPREHVDIMFISSEQQRLISQVCEPFYQSQRSFTD